VRALCDRYDILLCADEVITGFGRLGYWFGSERYDIRPELITCAKGLSSSYAAIGGVIATDRVAEPFLTGKSMYTARDHLRRPPRDGGDRAEEHRDHEAGTDRRACPRARGAVSSHAVAAARAADRRRSARHGLLLRARARQGKETRETFTDEECEHLLRGFLSPRLLERGLICRADDRGEPVIQLSPPLIAGPQEFDRIVEILADVLEEARQELVRRSAALATT